MLSEQRELLQLTVENVSEGIALVDGELSMILWNEAFCDLFGYTQDLVQKTDNAAVLMRITAGRGELGPGDPDMILQAFIASIKSTESRRIEIQRTDGRILDIWRKTISGGRFIMTARDVTEERQIQHLKDELVTTVSHELRTPLTAISGSLGLMDAGVAGPLPEKAAQLVRIAHKNSERLARLVNDLLDMDKLRSGSAVFNFAPVDLRGLLTDSVEQNGPYADRFGVRVALEMPDLLLVAMADADRMGQVLANLLSNAAKFSPPGSVVTVRLAMQDGQARISVIDRGPGISAEFRKRIFSRFAQEAGSSHRGQAGTGLGLAISKNIVEHHGGTIMLDPDTSGGAAFHIQLPVVGVEKEPR